MSSNPKIKPTHLDRCACVYVRQSTATQVQHNRESTLRLRFEGVPLEVVHGRLKTEAMASRMAARSLS